MSLQTRMNNAKINESKTALKNNAILKDRNARADALVEAWDAIPNFGNLKNLPLTEARNTAINLDRQASYMKTKLQESGQLSSAFSGFTPENMLRLVRLAMPNIVRNKIFTEFAMETARDSIKYMKPIFSKTQNGKGLNNRATDPDTNGSDPWGYNDHNDNVADTNGEYNPEAKNAFSNNADNLHKTLYESTEDRYVQELANGTVAGPTAGEGEAKSFAGNYTITFDASNFATKDENGALASYDKLIMGYTTVYYGDETHPIISEMGRGQFGVGMEFASVVKSVVFTSASGTTPASLAFTIDATEAAKEEFTKTLAAIDKELDAKGRTKAVRAYARYDSEDDFVGDYLGEVQLKMESFEFRPRPTTIGVTWSELSELVLDSSFNVSAQEELVTFAAQEIRVALDYKAIRTAYQYAMSNPVAYKVHFKASVIDGNDPTSSGFNAFGYKQNAQTFSSAVAKLEDVMLNDMNRGGVSRMVAGPAAGSYCYLLDSYTSKGAQSNIGAHQIGEILNGIPLFKVPSSIIPNNRILTVYKNEANESDVSLIFGTFVPFYSTGVITRKNFYKEAGIANYGDWRCLNKRYLGIIQIDGMKDAATN